jgi:transposase
MNRIKALYRSWAIPCSGATVYAPRHRAEWLAKILEPGVRLRAERLYQQLDLLQPVRQQARRDLLRESHKHPAVKLLLQIPAIGPIRAALLVALLQTPHRFRTKRQLWPGPLYDFYVGLLEKGMRPTMARLTLARKIATITLTIWKKE